MKDISDKNKIKILEERLEEAIDAMKDLVKITLHLYQEIKKRE